MFDSITAFLTAHAAITTAILLGWPLITALVNLLFGAAEKYAESHPTFHVVLSFIESAGFDARGTLAALAKLLPAKGAAKQLLALVMFGELLANVQACTKQQGQQALNDLPDDANCALAIVGDFTAAVDIPGTLAKCGIAVDDLINLIANKLTVVSGDGGAGLSPELTVYKARLASWMQAAQAFKAAKAGH